MAPEPIMEKTESNKLVLLSGWLLAVTALLGTGLITTVNWYSQPYIEENERQMLIRSLNTVIPPQLYDNDILHDTTMLQDLSLLGSKNPIMIYRARKSGEPVAAAMRVIAPNGYSGPIVLLVGIKYAGEVTGVRVVKHQETPGLGDAIDIERSFWIEVFTGKSLANPGQAGWKVKRDGGQFDQFTGATITPRAVVSAVHNALQFFVQNRHQVFSDKVSQNSEATVKPQ